MAIGADAAQQMNISQFNDFMKELKVFGSKSKKEISIPKNILEQFPLYYIVPVVFDFCW
ncbi:bifunctional 3-deoxy-7-phosphoheptulonate synthase/chorismate mutase [Bacillus cereus Rock3-28]|nr:bifunctional 3-deoxy-7-phosphoheptulonate synthase/chorismate mutase [Bacillus cereus Rock3-28]